MDLVRIVLWLGIALGTAGFVYVFVILPRQLQRGAMNMDLKRLLPGDDLVPDPKTGYTQAINIRAPKEVVWRWLIQIGYMRAGWYTYDMLHRLVGISGCVDDPHHSAKRIIPELQDLRVGDKIEIAPGMGYSVTRIECEQTLIMESILDSDKWEAVSAEDPIPEKYLKSSWVWIFEEKPKDSTCLTVRVRSDYSPGLLSTLSAHIPNMIGEYLMQPKTLRTLKQRAEDHR